MTRPEDLARGLSESMGVSVCVSRFVWWSSSGTIRGGHAGHGHLVSPVHLTQVSRALGKSDLALETVLERSIERGVAAMGRLYHVCGRPP